MTFSFSFVAFAFAFADRAGLGGTGFGTDRVLFPRAA